MSTSIKNIAKAFAAASFGQIINILSQLLLVPLFLKYWGLSLYGEWLILSSAPNIIAMAGDLGFGSAAANDMNLSMAKQNKKEALSVFQNTWITITTFSFIFIGISFLLLNNVALREIINIKILSKEYSIYIILFLLLRILVNQQNYLLNAGLRCEGNYALGLFLINISKFAEFLTVSILLFLYKISPYTVAIVYLTISILSWAILKLVLMKLSPWLGYGFKHFSIRKIKEQLPVALSFISFPVTNALSIQGIITIIGILMGSTEVVIFSTTRTFMNVLKQGMNIIKMSIWAELTSAYGKNNLQKARKIFINSNRVTILAISFFILSVAAFGRPLYQYWTKNEVHPSDTFFYAYAIIASINAFWFVNGVVQESTNRTQKIAIYNFISILIILCGTFILSKFFDLYGVLIAFALAELYMCFHVVKDTLNILNYKYSHFYGDLFKVKAYYHKI